MENVFSPKTYTVQNSPLVTCILSCSPVWMALLSMLRPMDIVSLARATQFRIKPGVEDRQVCMKWWRQTFHDMRWVREYRCQITVIGKDLVRLNYALERWQYFNTSEMKLLLIVKERPLPDPIQRYERGILIQSIDTSFMWGANTYKIPPGPGIQTCVVFLDQHMYVDLDFTWASDLLEIIQATTPLHDHGVPYFLNTQQNTLMPLPPIDPIPAGLRELGLDRYPVSDPWFRAWHVNLRMPDFMIDASITRFDLTIDRHTPSFDERESALRLALANDGSVVVPTIPEHILYMRSVRNGQHTGLLGLGW